MKINEPVSAKGFEVDGAPLYSQSEIDTLLSNKAQATHTHDLEDITDAGTAAGINISVGTTSPVGPSVGDLWVDTN